MDPYSIPHVSLPTPFLHSLTKTKNRPVAAILTLVQETCAYMSQKHPDFSVLAARIAISNLYFASIYLLVFMGESGMSEGHIVTEDVRQHSEKCCDGVEYETQK